MHLKGRVGATDLYKLDSLPTTLFLRCNNVDGTIGARLQIVPLTLPRPSGHAIYVAAFLHAPFKRRERR